MLEPAALHKMEIERAFQRLYYTDTLFYINGNVGNYVEEVLSTDPIGGECQYACVNSSGDLLGYFSFSVNWKSRNIFNIVLIRFGEERVTLCRDVLALFDKVIREWDTVNQILKPRRKKYI